MKSFKEFRNYTEAKFEKTESDDFDKWIKSMKKKYGKKVEIADTDDGGFQAYVNDKLVAQIVPKTKQKGKKKSRAKGRDPTGGRLSKGQSVYD